MRPSGYDLIRAMGASIVGMFTLCLGVRDSSDVQGLSSPTLDLLARGELEFVYSWRQLLRLAAGSPGR